LMVNNLNLKLTMLPKLLQIKIVGGKTIQITT
jgi:hypothetical protein